jgi:hypothetical protein
MNIDLGTIQKSIELKEFLNVLLGMINDFKEKPDTYQKMYSCPGNMRLTIRLEPDFSYTIVDSSIVDKQ